MRRLILIVSVFAMLGAQLRASASLPVRGYMALTFDDGPSGAQTELLLDGLAEREVSATFFVCAYRVREHPDNLCRMAREGHEIGLHSCCHAYMHKMSAEQILDDIAECRLAVTEVCGISPVLFRPPGGLCSETLLQAAKQEDLRVILWSVDTLDWNNSLKAGAYSRFVSQAADGQIILMHELSQHSIDTALRAIDRLQSEGWRFCTVSELARRHGVTPEPGKSYLRFGG